MTPAVVPSVMQLWHAQAVRSPHRLHCAKCRPDFVQLKYLYQTAMFWAPFKSQLIDCVHRKQGAVQPFCLLPVCIHAVMPGSPEHQPAMLSKYLNFDEPCSHSQSLHTHCKLTPTCCRLVADRGQHLVQQQQVLFNQQLREQHAQMEQARPLVALLVTGVAHKVPEACCCTVDRLVWCLTRGPALGVQLHTC